jgi:hypothetical protein
MGKGPFDHTPTTEIIVYASIVAFIVWAVLSFLLSIPCGESAHSCTWGP